MEQVRNFSIIAHVDHGKSTFSDRLLEYTNTVAAREMKKQILDQMDLERERGITIKMQPVTMKYKNKDDLVTLNLIDTPGHVDFSYEVSRSLRAVEGAILLVDSTQGIEAQTLSVLQHAKEAGLVIIPALSKVDSPLAEVERVKAEVSLVLDCDMNDIIHTSGKTGEGTKEIIEAVIKKIPAPKEEAGSRALVFDFSYESHVGLIAYVRAIGGTIEKGESYTFLAGNVSFQAREVGIFTPEREEKGSIKKGEIGYIVTGIKEISSSVVGDTIQKSSESPDPLPGYTNPKPLIWASFYPQTGDKFVALQRALIQLRLSDSAFSFEIESSEILGKGFRCGFLGLLHLEIIAERVRREFDIELILTSPGVGYLVATRDGEEKIITNASKFPSKDTITSIKEPWVSFEILVPKDRLDTIIPLINEFEAITKSTESLGFSERLCLSGEMPLRELSRNFFDALGRASSGYASLSYKPIGMKEAQVVRMDILIAEEIFPAFSKIVSQVKVEKEARATVERLHQHLPKQMFSVKIQAKANGRILASKTLSAYRKDVTAKLYGGDITRKMKLREKQKKGKSRMQKTGAITVPHEVFLKVIID